MSIYESSTSESSLVSHRKCGWPGCNVTIEERERDDDMLAVCVGHGRPLCPAHEWLYWADLDEAAGGGRP
jgi:hypothetical protein